MTPTLMGRLQTRIFLAMTAGVLWTAIITPVLPRPAGMSSGFAYHVTFEALGLMAGLGLGWEIVYHVIQQSRWDKDWPSLFALLVVVNEAIPLWFVTHALNVIPGTVGFSSPIIPLYVIHVSTTWLMMWLFMQGPLRVVHIRWRFEGGRVLVRAPGKLRRRSAWPGMAGAGAVGTTAAGTASGQAAGAGPQAASSEHAAASAGGASLAAVSPDVVEGTLCRHGHFGHPESRYCLLCGSSLLPLTSATALRSRPPAGIMILGDGRTQVLDRDLSVTAAASAGELGFIPLDEQSGALAHIRLVGWQPVVSSPVSAMSLLLPGGNTLRVDPGVPVPLVPGAELTVGEHQIRYESPHQAWFMSPGPPALAADAPVLAAAAAGSALAAAAAAPLPSAGGARPGRIAPRRRLAAASLAAAVAAVAAGIMAGVTALPRLVSRKMAGPGGAGAGVAGAGGAGAGAGGAGTGAGGAGGAAHRTPGGPQMGLKRAATIGSAAGAVLLTAATFVFVGKLAIEGTGPQHHLAGGGPSPVSTSSVPHSPAAGPPGAGPQPSQGIGGASPSLTAPASPGSPGQPGPPWMPSPGGPTPSSPPTPAPSSSPPPTPQPTPAPTPTRPSHPKPGSCPVRISLGVVSVKVCSVLLGELSSAG